VRHEGQTLGCTWFDADPGNRELAVRWQYLVRWAQARQHGTLIILDCGTGARSLGKSLSPRDEV
jgi:hypothetical protein